MVYKMISLLEIDNISCNIWTKEFKTNSELKYHMIRQYKEDPVSFII